MPMNPISQLKFLVESNAFGVCTRIGEKLHMPTRNIRLFFIYTSCLTVGSPLVIYLILAFWMQMKYYVKANRNPVWDF